MPTVVDSGLASMPASDGAYALIGLLAGAGLLVLLGGLLMWLDRKGGVR